MAVARLRNFDAFTPKHLGTYRLFCLHGENDALIRERAVELHRAFASSGTAPAVVDLDGETLSREPFALADELRAMSLFAERRLIRVTLGARAAHEAFAKAMPALPSADGVVVVIDAGSDKRQEEAIRLLSGDAASLVIPCPPDEPDDLADWARRSLAECGITVDLAVARELAELADNDRALLAGELMKLSLLCDIGSTLDGAVLRAAVADGKKWLLDDAAERILAGDLSAALDTTDRLKLLGSDAAQLAGVALRKALWMQRSASGTRATHLRRVIKRLDEAVRASRSSDPMSQTRAENTLIHTARTARRS